MKHAFSPRQTRLALPLDGADGLADHEARGNKSPIALVVEMYDIRD